MKKKTIRIPARLYRSARLGTHYTKYGKVLTRPGNLVPGVGDPCAKVMLIGEAPGEEEDLQGKPFCGRSGQLLHDMLDSIDMERGRLFITNLIKVRPPGNRIEDVIDEVPPAMTLMRWEIDILNPKVIVPLGRWATGLFFQDFSITFIASQMYVKQSRVVVPMLHPSYILRQRNHAEYKKHFQNLKKIIDDVA